MANYTTEISTEDEKIAKRVYANHFTTHRHIKDDLIQSAMIAMWQSRSAFKDKSLLSTYLYKTAKRAMLNCLRKELKTYNDISMFEEIGEELRIIDTLQADNYNELLEHKRYMWVLDTIQEYVATLDERSKKIIHLYMNRRSFDEIAKQVGLSKSTVHDCIKIYRRTMALHLGLDIVRGEP